MKLRNILVGLSFGICLLAASLAISHFLPVNPLGILFAFGCLIAIAVGIRAERKRRAFLKRYWTRKCTGILWKRRFPNNDASEIRQFLDLFVSAFGFRARQKLFFSPYDEVMEIFHGLNPEGFPDCLELEEFAMGIRKVYGTNVEEFWREDITLGELFDRTRAV